MPRIALKTRVYLHMGRYADVIAEANKIVSANAPFTSSAGIAHTLAPAVADVFKTPYTHVERIFNFPFTENDLPGTQNGLGSYYNPGPRYWRLFYEHQWSDEGYHRLEK